MHLMRFLLLYYDKGWSSFDQLVLLSPAKMTVSAVLTKYADFDLHEATCRLFVGSCSC